MKLEIPKNPWIDLEINNQPLNVYDFPTTLMSIVGNVLRREVTMPYVEKSGLGFVEWKILSVLWQGNTLSFQEIEHLSSTDKSLVSKGLRTLESKGLVKIQDRGHTGKKQLNCTITELGKKTNDEVMSDAQNAQIELIKILTQEERVHLFNCLQKWHFAFMQKPLPRPED